MKKSCMIAVIALMAATGAYAAEKDAGESATTTEAAPADAGAADTAAAGKQKMICKKDRVTGSLSRSNRVCMTKQQWEDLYDATRKKVDDFQSNGTMRRDGQTNANGN